jgi:hypothetical protein
VGSLIVSELSAHVSVERTEHQEGCLPGVPSGCPRRTILELGKVVKGCPQLHRDYPELDAHLMGSSDLEP